MSDSVYPLNGPAHMAMQDGSFTPPSFNIMEHCCICLGRLSLLALCPLTCPCSVRTVNDYERAVKLRLGKQMHKATLEGGMHVLVPCVDSLLQIDIREKLLDIPKQSIITKEGLSLRVDAVVYYKVFDATRALLGIENVSHGILMLAQTKLREVLGMQTFDQVQNDRSAIADSLKQILDEATDPWGIDVTRVEITDLALPPEMQRAMGTEAEAQRNAKAKLIEAEGERNAAATLKEAADVMATAPQTMQLRFLQTLHQISADRNSTIIVPFPSELLTRLAGK